MESFTEWILSETPSYEFLLATIALLPIIAYPFLPSPPRSGVRCEFFLLWPGIFGILLILIELCLWGGPKEKITIAGYYPTRPLIICSTLAGLESFLMQAPRVAIPRPPRDSDDFKLFYAFNMSLQCAMGFVTTTPVVLFMDDLFPGYFPTTLGGWLEYLMRFLVIGFGVLALGFAGVVCLHEWGPPVLDRFIARRVSWWYWLPENGALDEFGPPWSMAIAALMVIVPVVAFFAAVMKL